MRTRKQNPGFTPAVSLLRLASIPPPIKGNQNLIFDHLGLTCIRTSHCLEQTVVSAPDLVVPELTAALRVPGLSS